MKPTWTLSVGIVLLAASQLAAQDKEWKIGQIVVTRFGAELKQDGKVVYDEGRALNRKVRGKDVRDGQTSYRVMKVEPHRVLLSYKDEGWFATGWVDREWVMTLDQAIDFYTAELKTRPTSELYVERGRVWDGKEELKKAVDDYTEAIRLKPTNELAFLQRAITKIKFEYALPEASPFQLPPIDMQPIAPELAREMVQSAIKDFDRAIELDPNYVKAYLKRSQRIEYENEKKAEEDLAQVIRLLPNDPIGYLARAKFFDRHYKVDKEIEDINVLIKLSSDKKKYLRMRAEAWVRSQEPEKAEADYTELIGMEPKNSQWYRARGGFRLRISEYDKAIADFTEAIRIDPELTKSLGTFVDDDGPPTPIDNPLKSRALAYQGKGDHDKALADYDQLVRDRPDLSDSYTSRASFYWTIKKDYKKALLDYNTLIEKELYYESSQLALYHDIRARLWMNLEDNDKAMTELNKAIEIDPKFSSPYRLRGQVWSVKDEFQKALADFDKAIELEIDEIEVFVERGQTLFYLNEFERAIKDFDKALQENPKEKNVYNYRGISHYRLNHYEEAIRDLDQAIKIDPKDEVSMTHLAWILAAAPQQKLRDGKRAVEMAMKACELSKDKPEYAFDALAAAYAEVSDFAAAVKWQEKSLDLTDNDNEAEVNFRQSQLDLYLDKQVYRLPE